MHEAQPALRRELRLWHLILFNVSAVAGVRWLASAAHAGPGSLTLWLLAALAFLLPSALVVSTLSARFPEEGGERGGALLICPLGMPVTEFAAPLDARYNPGAVRGTGIGQGVVVCVDRPNTGQSDSPASPDHGARDD